MTHGLLPQDQYIKTDLIKSPKLLCSNYILIIIGLPTSDIIIELFL